MTFGETLGASFFFFSSHLLSSEASLPSESNTPDPPSLAPLLHSTGPHPGLLATSPLPRRVPAPNGPEMSACSPKTHLARCTAPGVSLMLAWAKCAHTDIIEHLAEENRGNCRH